MKNFTRLNPKDLINLQSLKNYHQKISFSLFAFAFLFISFGFTWFSSVDKIESRNSFFQNSTVKLTQSILQKAKIVSQKTSKSEEFIGLSSSFIISNLLKQENGKVATKDIEAELSAFNRNMMMGGCSEASVIMVDLRGSPGFSQTDYLVTCGEPDTLALLLYTNAPNPLQNMTLNVELPTGLEYGGFVLGDRSGMINAFDISDPQNPVFTIPELTQDSFMVAYIGVRANCENSPKAAQYFVDYNASYAYTDDFGVTVLCEEDFTPTTEFNNAVKTPVLNTLSVTPEALNFSKLDQNLWHTIEISQDGINSYLDSFVFKAHNLDLSIGIEISEVLANNTQIFDYQYNPATLEFSATVPNAAFLQNIDPLSRTPNNKFDTNERMKFYMRYKMPECQATSLQEISYSTSYNCDGIECQNPSFKLATLKQAPSFAPKLNATAEMTQQGGFCGDNIIVDFTMASSLADSTMGMFEDITVQISNCSADNVAIAKLTIGNTVLPDSTYGVEGGFVEFYLSKLTVDPDGEGIGLEDVDGDGRYDDLPGGNTINATVEFAMVCPADASSCSAAGCDIYNVAVLANYNCGLSRSQVIGAVTPNVTFQYNSEMEFPNLDTIGTSTLAYNFGTFGNGVSKTKTIQICYNSTPENLTLCNTSTSHLEVDIKGRSYEVFDAEISNISFEGTSTTDYSVKDDTTNNNRTFIINIGSSDNNTQLCYEFDITFDTSVCAPPTYLALDARVVEECSGACTCTLTKGCESTLLYTDPNSTGCICDIESRVVASRLSTGYTDKSMATKMDTSQIAPLDKTRFLPGDTILLSTSHEVKNEDNVNLVNRLLYFYVTNRRIDSAEPTKGTEGMEALFDPAGMHIEEFKFIPAATGVPIDLGGLMCTVADPNKSNYGLGVYGPHRSYETACPTQPGLPNVQSYDVAAGSSNDIYDGYILRTYFYNWDNQTPAEPSYSGDCISPILDMIGGAVNNGDKFIISYSVPLIKNPEFDPAQKVAQVFNAYSGAQKWDNNAKATVTVATSCTEPFPFDFHSPEITVDNTMNLDNCGAEIVHTFKVSNPVPTGWYQNEYRPVMGISQFYSDIPDPLVYNSGAEITDVSGVTKSLVVDSTSFSPLLATYNGVDYFTTNTSTEDKMRLIFQDAELKNGIENGYDCSLTDVSISGGGTIPLMGVGLNNDDSLVVRIPLERLCVDPVDVTDLEVSFDYAYPYLPDLNHINWYCHGTSGSIPRGDCDPNDVSTHNKYYWADRTRDSRTNPHFGSDTSNVYNITDISTGFPSLSAAITSSMLVDIFGTSEMNTYTVTAGSIGGGTHTNVVTSITVPNSVALLNVTGGASSFTLVKSTDSTKIYSINLPNLVADDEVILSIETEQLFCTTEPADSKVCLATSSGCQSPEKAAAILGQLGGNTCAGAGACYVYDVKESDIQGEWIIQPNEFPLCSEVEYGIRIKNVKTSQLNNILAQWWLPKGLIPTPGSWKFAYPHGPTNQEAFVDIPDPIRNTDEDGVYGTAYTYADDSDFSAWIDANGLIGINANTALTDSNQFVIKFKATTDCNEFVSGSELRFRVNASGACEASVTSGVVQTEQQIIEGANPVDYAQILTIVDPLNMNCGAATTPMSITGLNVSETGATQNTKMTLTLPGGMDYAGGGVTFLSPSGFTPTNFTATTLGNGTEIEFDVPDDIGPGGFFQIEVPVSINETLGCGNVDMGIDATSFLPAVSCSNGPECGVYVRNTVNPTTPISIKPPLNSDNLIVTSLCENDPNNVTLQYAFDISNPGTATYNDAVTIEVIQDLNGNLKADDFEPVLATAVENINIAEGDTLAILGDFTLPEAGSCPSILKLSYNTTCDCKTNEIIIDKVEPEFFAELGDKKVLCPNQDLKFPVCGDFDFTLSPTTAGTVTLGTDSVTVSLNKGAGTLTPVFLNLAGTQAQCEFEYSLPIYSAEPFEIGPYSVQEVCENSCTKLDLKLPGSWEGNVSILWSPATYLDDPTSETPEICNPLSDITYTVSVTNLDGGCVAMADYELIVNPLGVAELNVSGAQNCYKFSDPRHLTATTGFDNYSFYKIVNGSEIPVQAGASNKYFAPANANNSYIVKAKNDADPCPSVSPTIVLTPLDTCPSLGNLVWEDTNNNGTVDTGENGIADVELILFDLGIDGIKSDDDTEIIRDTTDTNGNYLFTDLDPDDYYVKINSVPTGLLSSTGTGVDGSGNNNYEPGTDPDNDTNNNDDGTQMTMPTGVIMIMSDPVTLTINGEPTNDGDGSADSNLSVDFGLFEGLSIGNLVWEDANNDGIADNDESGIEDIEVILYKDGGNGTKEIDGSGDDVEIGKDTTDSHGAYLFADLIPGVYYLKLNNISAGFVSSTGEGPTTVTGAGDNEPAADPDATNTNGDDDGTQMTMSDGSIMVMSDLISLTIYGEPTDDGDTDDNTNYAVDFGLFQTLSLGNLVWEDLDNDGAFNGIETGMAGIEVILFHSDNATKGDADDTEVIRDTTDENGNYLFENLLPGEYFVKINELPVGYVSSTGEGINSTSNSGNYEPAPDADNDTDNLDDGIYMDGMVMSTLVSLELEDEPINDGDTENNTNLTVDFGLFQTLTLGNLVWEDLNNNGIADEGEPGMEGIEVILYRDGGNGTKEIDGSGDDVEIARDTTDTNGNYSFVNLEAGMYYLKLSGIQSGYMSSTGEGTEVITGSGDYEPAPDPDVYVDMDDNGTQMDMPDGSIMIMSDLISMVLYDEQTDSVTNMDVDFGLYTTLEAGNLVWKDDNNNGVVDNDEEGIAGVEVIIYSSTDDIKGNEDDVEIGRDTTDTDGMYLFQNLEAGDYWVKLNSGIPDGYYSSTGEGPTNVTGTGTFEPSSMVDDNIDDNDDGTQMIMPDGSIMVMSDIVSLDLYDEPDSDGNSPNTANYRIDFGLYESLELGNLVWEDKDNDGIKDADESGFPNIEVVLYQLGPDGQKGTADDVAVAIDTTDADGSYLFDNLNPGNYFVKLNDIPTGFVSSTGEGAVVADGTGTNEPAADADDNTDNDDDGSNMFMEDGSLMVMSEVISIALEDEPTDDGDTDNTTNYTVDFGLFETLELGNLVWEDLNNNGIADNGELGIENIEVILFKDGGNGTKDLDGSGDDIEIERDTTDSNGAYLFADLYPGEYFIKLNSGIPAHFVSSTGEGTTGVTGTGTNEPAADPDATNTNGDDDGTLMVMADGSKMIMSDLISMVLYDEPTNDEDTDNTTNYAVDFGLYEQLSIGNLVWEDLDNDGIVDADESGIEGIEVILYLVGPDGQKNTTDDVEVDRQLTDADGSYMFEDLNPNDYWVKLNSGIPANMFSSTGEGVNSTTDAGPSEPAASAENNIDNVDDGTQMVPITIGMVMSDIVSLTLYEEPIDDADTNNSTNTTVDFGLFQKLVLAGTVWEDRNNDGIPDNGESNLNNIEVILYKSGPDNMVGTADDIEIATTATDVNGNYQFEGLNACTYYVKLNNLSSNLASSDGNGFGAYNGSGPLEPATDPDNNIDGDDNGNQMNETMVVSDIIDLVLYGEPTDDGDDLDYTNTTVDFGLTYLSFIRIFDPCNCLGNESTTGAGDGQFSDKITILSSVPNETWTLKSNRGLKTIASNTPPAIPTPISIGTIVPAEGTEDGYYRYSLNVKHIDGEGYSAVFTNGKDELPVENYCTYDGSCSFIVTINPDGTPGTPEVNPSKQTFIVGTSNTPKIDTLKACDNLSMFMDDGILDGLYVDSLGKPRDNKYTICPQNQWQSLQFNFTQFSTAPGDILYVHDGKNISAPLIGEYEGDGVSQTGGWVTSNCDPDTNATGCLTFRFVTNGDNRKSNGWMANIACSERNIELTPPNDLNAKLECEETYAVFDIKPATVMSGCGAVQDSQIVRVFNAKGEVCLDTCLAITDVVTDTFGLGIYLVEYKLKSDTVKTAKGIMSVQGAALVCNDEVTIPFGAACSIALTPDDLVEGACDTITDTVYQYITIEYVDANGNTQTVSGGGKGGNYPVITKDMVNQCGGQVKATIEKRYYEGLDFTFCNNGQQSISCTTIINVIDQSAPLFQNLGTVDTFKLCSADLSPDDLGIPTPKAIDNCDSVAVEFTGINILNQGSSCDTTRAEISWRATDACGNSTTTSQLVVILRPDANDVVQAPDVILSCGEDNESTINDFARTGMPGIKVGKIVNGILEPTDTIALDTLNYTCGYILQKRDIQVPADCGIKVFRYWSVLDWCDSQSGIIPLDTQFIELRDTLAPTFVDAVLATAKLDLPHNACTTDLEKLTRPVATDKCTQPTVRLDAVFRIEDGALWPVGTTNLDCDSFQVRWVAEDNCHSLSRPFGTQSINDTLTQIVLIEDNTKPSAVCTDKINFSLARNEGTLHYREIDAGSSDACGIKTYEVSRDNVNWDSIVTFTCEDTHEEVQVYLRVTDKKGNQNTCWMTVNVEDKVAPICSDLPDMTGSCDDGHVDGLIATDTNENGTMDDSEWVDMAPEQVTEFNTNYGNPDCSDNVDCGALVIEQQYQFIEKACGIATIKRRYRAVDWDGEGRKSNWSEQTINIESKANWSITLPSDWKGECGDDIPTSHFYLTNGACDLMAYEVDEKVFTTTEDACLKVVRTFTIINWCIYEAGQDAVTITRDENEHGLVTQSSIITSKGYENVGKLEYVQVLKLQDDTAPIITIGKIDNCLEGADCQAIKRFAITAKDCNDAATKALTYTWTISANEIQLATGEGSAFEYPVAAKVAYKVRWTAADNCGNTAWEEEVYEFWDCKKPTPYCLNGIAVELMPDAGMIQVWATDLERNSADNCTSHDKLQFKIWHANLGDEPVDLASVQALPEVITFDCTTLGTQTVILYVIDEEGNWDFCITYVIIQDNMGACANTQEMALVTGTIKSWKGKAVEDVMVHAMDNRQMMTTEDGQFDFELAMNNDYTIQPEKNDRPLNGVSTFDLILITKHILGKEKFDNPYQMIAADVNGSGTITAFDMVQTRQLILNINKEFTNNSSWRFVDASYEFTTDSPMAENFSEVTQISNLRHDMVTDFVAIKVGDVNGNARPNSLVQGEDRTTANAFEITTEDKVLKAGETYSLDFNTKQLAAIQGYQFTLGYKNLTLEKLQSGVVPIGIGIENFGLHKMDEGFITTSWNEKVSSQSTTDNSQSITLFTINFTAQTDGKLSDQLSMLDRPTVIEAYDQDNNLMDIQLIFTAPYADNQFELFQNQPNPFHDNTMIGFYLPGDSEVQLVLRDETGRLLKSMKADKKAGYNTIQLNNSELTNGFIYYQLSTKYGTQAKKMLKLK